jgi:hypothetical protein
VRRWRDIKLNGKRSGANRSGDGGVPKKKKRPVRGPVARYGLCADRGYQRLGDLWPCLVGGLSPQKSPKLWHNYDGAAVQKKILWRSGELSQKEICNLQKSRIALNFLQIGQYLYFLFEILSPTKLSYTTVSQCTSENMAAIRFPGLRVRPETHRVFSKPCVRVSGRRDGRRDAGASQGRLDEPGREHEAPIRRAGRAPLRRQRPSTMLQHRLRPVSWRGHPSNSLKTRYVSPDGLLAASRNLTRNCGRRR